MFVKGKSGNPAGRRKGTLNLPEVRALLKPYAKDIVGNMVKLMAHVIGRQRVQPDRFVAADAEGMTQTLRRQIPDHAVADMSPPRRRACGRLASRMHVLSDGKIVSCEQDVLGRQPLGHLATDRVAEVWAQRFAALRSDHRRGEWGKHSLCGNCREWHRP